MCAFSAALVFFVCLLSIDIVCWGFSATVYLVIRFSFACSLIKCSSVWFAVLVLQQSQGLGVVLGGWESRSKYLG